MINFSMTKNVIIILLPAFIQIEKQDFHYNNLIRDYLPSMLK